MNSTRREAAAPYWNEWNEGFVLAKREHKPVIAYFINGYRLHWTLEYPLFIPEIKRHLAKDWVCINIDIYPGYPTVTFHGKQMTTAGLAYYFHVDKFPAFLFFDKEGNPIQTVTGFMREITFGELLDYMENEVYAKNISFEEYRKTLKATGR